MTGTIAIVGPDESVLEGLLPFAPDDVDVKWVDSNQPIDARAEQMRDAVALLHAGAPFDMELVRRCPRLKLIQTLIAGVDRFDLPALAEMGVQVANNRGGNAVAVAEHTVMLIVAVHRKLRLQFEKVRAGEWSGTLRRDWQSQAYEIDGQTVGIIGMGFIGREVVRRLQGWGCSIVYFDTVHPPAELVDELRLRSVSMDNLLERVGRRQPARAAESPDTGHDRHSRASAHEAYSRSHQYEQGRRCGRGCPGPGATRRRDRGGGSWMSSRRSRHRATTRCCRWTTWRSLPTLPRCPPRAARAARRSLWRIWPA